MTNTAVAGLWGDSPTHPCSSDGDSERCHCGEPFVDEEPAAAQIARLKAENAELVKAVEKLCLVASREAAISDEEWREIVAQARKALAKAKEAR